MGKKLNTNIFIEKCNKIYNNKYDYSLTEYVNNKTNVKVICPIHGIFELRADGHLNGYGCKNCIIEQRRFLKTTAFVNAAKRKFQNKFDYSLVKYINAGTKVKIICKEHGIFEQLPGLHLKVKHGCLKCSGQNKTSIDFINECNKIHGNKYDYSLVNYVKSNVKIKIICPKHGIFEQTPNYHKKMGGCPVCNISRGENIIRSYLIRNNINFIKNYSFETCKYKNVLKFDFYLPDLNLCIEYDGVQYFVPIDYFGGIKTFNYIRRNDIIKNNFCKENKINLIRFKYNENDLFKKIENIKL